MPAKFTGPSQVVAQQVLEYLYEFDDTYEVTIKKYKEERSLSQNGLMWMWFTAMAKHFSRADKKLTKDDMHDLMVFKFLGTHDTIVGHTVIEGQLKKTSKLDKAEFTHFLEQVEFWAADLGLVLPVPMGSVYYEQKNRQTQ